MSNDIFPVMRGLGFSVGKTLNLATRYQRAVSGRELRVFDYTNPIWNFILTYSILRDNLLIPTSPVASPVPYNPFDKSVNITLTGGDFVATTNLADTWAAVRTIGGINAPTTTGMYYFEVQYADLLASPATRWSVGIANPFAALNNFVGFDQNALGYFAFNGDFYNNNIPNPGIVLGLSTNDWVGVAVNLNINRFWVQNVTTGAGWNTNMAGTQNPSTGAGGFLIPASVTNGQPISIMFAGQYYLGGTPDVGPLNTGQSAFVGTIPTGFSAWQSWNTGLIPGFTSTELRTMMNFFLAHRGAFDTFLFRDPDDYIVAAQPFGIGDGTTAQFQLVRSLVPGGFAENIIAPQTISTIYNNGTPVSGAFYSVDYSTGIVTFFAVPSLGDVLTVDFTYYFRVRFNSDALDFEEFMHQLWEIKQLKLQSVLL